MQARFNLVWRGVILFFFPIKLYSILDINIISYSDVYFSKYILVYITITLDKMK